MANDVKKVLIVTYYFPPSGGAGVQRVLKNVKYLQEYGWQPVVLTVHEGADFPARDPSLLKEIPADVPVYRTAVFEPYSLYRRFTGKHPGMAADISSLADPARRTFSERLSEWIRATFFIPDARCFWRRPAVRAGLKIIKEHNIDLVLSSAPPYTCHLIGRDLHRRSDVPWIAEFRDSWVGWLSAPRRRFLPAVIDRYLERSVVREADMVITATEGVKEDLLTRSVPEMRDKFRVITNGYDSADFTGREGSPPAGTFTITYTGSLYGKRSPEVFLQALRQLVTAQPQLQERLHIRFVGRVDPHFLELFKPFGSMISSVPYVPHAESIGYLLSSHLLLLIIDDAPVNRGILTGKLYEYLGARRPVLALAPEGEAAAFIRRVGAGTVVHPADRDEIARQLASYLAAWEQHTLQFRGSGEQIDALDRKKLAGRLAALCTAVSAGKPPKGDQ